MPNKKHKLDNLKDLPSVLVIGGAGFVGSHLCQALLEKNCFVYCLDRLTAEKKANILKIINQKSFRLVKAEAKKPLKGLKFFDFNYIFYLSEPGRSLWGLARFLELAKKQKAKFLFLSSIINSQEKKLAETLTTKYFSHFNLDARIVRLIDVYGPHMSLKGEDDLSSLFRSQKLETIFKISGDGSKTLYPLFIKDAIQGLLKAMFSQSSKGKIYTLGGKSISILKFANILKKESGRTLGIEFAPREKVKQEVWKKKEVKETKKQLNWEPKTSFKKGVQRTILWLKQYQFLPEEKIKKNVFFKRLLFLFTFIISLTFPFIATLAFYYFSSISKIERLRDALLNYDLVTIEAEVASDLAFFQKGKQFLFNLSPTLSFLKLEKQTEVFFDIFDLGIHLGETGEITAQIVRQIDKLAGMVMQKQTGDFYLETEQLEFLLSQLRDRLSLMVVGRTKEEIEQIEAQLPFKREKINLARESIQFLPELLGFGDPNRGGSRSAGKRVYLVLLQNNLELRPTGGFISAYGLLTFENGKLLDFLVKNSQMIDSQLKGTIEPPSSLKQYLGEDSWYFRDSNWEPHFPEAADEAEWFVEKTLKRTVDGAISLDLYFFQDLLEVLGPVELAAEGEFITAENLLERAEYYLPLDPKEKEAFLNQLAQAVFNKIKEVQAQSWMQLMSVFNQGLEKKQILISLNEPKTAEFFNQKGWDGSMRKVSQQEHVLTDFLMLVEANLGVNQVNYFIDREISQEVVIMETGEVSEKITLTYENKSNSLRPPGGNYKNYLRAYLPLTAKLGSIKIGKDKDNLRVVSASKIDQFEAYEKRGIGFLIEVPIKETRIVEISYQLKDRLMVGNKLASYAFYWQKQPGISTDPLKIVFNFPEKFKVVETVPEVEASSRGVTFETDTEKDRLFLVSFNQN